MENKQHRTIARSLIEERMFLADPGELLVSRLTGHVGTVDEKSYHSATKDIESRLISLNNDRKYYTEKIDLIEQDTNINDNDLLDPNMDIRDFNTILDNLENDINNIVKKLPEYEDFLEEFHEIGIESLIDENEKQSVDIDALVEYFMDTYLVSQKELENIVQYLDCRKREVEYLHEYINKQRDEATRLREALKERHEINDEKFNNLVDIGPPDSNDQNTYNGFVNYLNGLYKQLETDFPGLTIK